MILLNFSLEEIAMVAILSEAISCDLLSLSKRIH